MQVIKLIYLAKFREVFNIDEEILEFSEDLKNVEELLEILTNRGDIWNDELGGLKPFGIAVNQDFSRKSTLLPKNAEVVLFPPITGG